MKLKELTIQEFLEKTYSKEPVPGGGSISALCGALAASLGQMVTGLTIGRKKYSDVESEMIDYGKKMEQARLNFLELIDEDAEAYQKVFDAFKMPKETEEQQKLRNEEIQLTTIKAAEVPLKVAQQAVGIMDSIFQIGIKGNRNAVTDACVAMMCARTAAFGAILNVRINLSGIEDENLVKEFDNKCMALQDEAQVKEASLLDTVSF